MDVLDYGSVLRLRNDDGNPAHLRSAAPPLPPPPPGGCVSPGGLGRKRRDRSDASHHGSQGCRFKRVWRIGKRVKRESSPADSGVSSVDDSCVHGRIVEAFLRGQGCEEDETTHRIDACVDSWGVQGMADRAGVKGSLRPWRFLFFEKGEWVEFGEDANSVAWERFRAGSATAEVTVEGRVYLLNFVEMTQVNVVSGYVRSIAWIGEGWEVSLPANPIASPSETSVLGKRILQHRTTWRDGAADAISSLMLGAEGLQSCVQDEGMQRCGEDVCERADLRGSREGYGDDDLTELRLGGGFGARGYGGSPCVSERKNPPTVVGVLEEKVGGLPLGVSPGLDPKPPSTLGPRFVKLEDGTTEFDDVMRKFVSGFGKLGDSSMITGIHRDGSPVAGVRLEAFARQKALTEQARGNANVRWGWHGTTKKGVAGIFLHGFGQPKTPKNGSAYGIGVYLAVENQAYVSALYADNDDNGEQHVVLCEVVTGAAELVKPPSEQFHPSSEHFDTGVDDLRQPKRLIVWSTHMNTHILPLYVVSFKMPPLWHRMMTEFNGKLPGFSIFCDEVPMRHPYFAKQAYDMAEALHNKPGGCGNREHGPTTAFVRFPPLCRFLQRLLSPEHRLILKNCYRKFEARSIDRKSFVQEIQKLVGKDCLIHAIKLFQGSEGTSFIKSQ